MKSIRITKDIMINVSTREAAERKYPHGTIESVPVLQSGWLKMFQAVYRVPQRIDAPTKWELNSLLASGHAKEIKRDPDLKTIDEPGGSESGSIAFTKKRMRKAAKEEYERGEAERKEKELAETETEPTPEKEPKRKYRKRDKDKSNKPSGSVANINKENSDS